jgi:hypothetical protein
VSTFQLICFFFLIHGWVILHLFLSLERRQWMAMMCAASELEQMQGVHPAFC